MSKVIPRLTLREACSALGIKRTSFYQHWADVFTDYRAGNRRRVSMDELEQATAYTDYFKARAAVLRLRNELGRK